MRQAMWTGGSRLELQEGPTPAPGPGEARVRVHACGVCMTEVHYAEGLVPPSTPPPFVFGHEWAGTVESLGPGVTGLAVGTPVAGASRGAFAEHVVLAAERVFPLPAGVPLEAGIFVEPLACCLASVEAARPTAGTTALVTGAGPMGQMVAQLARLAGARVLVSEPDERRRALALRLGAEVAVDPRRESLADAVAAATGGVGVDAAWETAGRPEPLADCLAAVREAGAVVMVGVNSGDAELALPLYRFHRRQLRLQGIYGAGRLETFRAAADMLPRLELTALISHRYGLGEIDEAFATAREGRGSKVIVEPGR
jgi:(R,R)-butanediol dehydrogenase/meso-butanediol dehydrogenase/diacetyl reductase